MLCCGYTTVQCFHFCLLICLFYYRVKIIYGVDNVFKTAAIWNFLNFQTKRIADCAVSDSKVVCWPPCIICMAVLYCRSKIGFQAVILPTLDWSRWNSAGTRLGLAILPLCRGTGPLWNFFDVCATEKNSIISVAPCLRPWSWWLLSFLSYESQNSIALFGCNKLFITNTELM